MLIDAARWSLGCAQESLRWAFGLKKGRDAPGRATGHGRSCVALPGTDVSAPQRGTQEQSGLGMVGHHKTV